MLQSYILAMFLYFPEDKSEYIPAAISFAVFLVFAIITMRVIIRASRKEAAKAKELEDKIMRDLEDKEKK
ncbi:hypothetical protein ACFYKX_17510 [Cytobacillus sp. FJAT-54145]|uniref:DUF4083 domain-containing protein n=1 Tax=Cytobacillus spartinae TaxID=3299023 RepID=A0ABW6KHT1_9BACI